MDSSFEARYVQANNRPGAPSYDASVMSRILEDLKEAAPEIKSMSNAILGAICIGAHRADIVPKFFDSAVSSNPSEAAATFDQVGAMVQTIWPFVGLPWTIAALMGITKVVEERGLVETVDTTRKRGDVTSANTQAGRATAAKTYRGVGNSEVMTTLTKYFPDLGYLSETVIFGYAIAGTTASGVFKDYETQLLVMSAIASSGATRQATSHAKASLGMGNSVEVVTAIFRAIKQFNSWNGTPIASVDVPALETQMREALGPRE